jgi:cobalt-zinc-cadmium efflux system membrane fusion protein
MPLQSADDAPGDVKLVTQVTDQVAEPVGRLPLSASEMERLGVRLESPVRVSRIPMPMLSATVTLPPASQHVVAAATAGLLSRMLIAPGDTVEVGEAIAVLDSPELVALQVQLLDAQSRLRLATSQLERDQGLFDDGIIPQRRYQQSRRDHEEASTAEALARARLALAGVSKSDLERLGSSRALSPRLTVVSPIAGTVLEQYEMPGARLHAADPIARIADLSELWMMLEVPPEVLRRIRPGQQVVLASAPDRPVARIDTLGSVLSAATQTVQVRAVLHADVAGEFSTGEFISVQVLETAPASGQVWLVPSAAVIHTASRQVIFLRDGSGFVILPVELVREDGGESLIRASLNDRARVAVSGTATLKALWQQ